MNTDINICKTIKNLRVAKGLSQKELADLFNKSNDNNSNSKISVQTISYWEKGREPSYEALILLSNIFNVSIAYFFKDTSLDNDNLDNILFSKDKRIIELEEENKMLKAKLKIIKNFINGELS